MTKLKIFTGLVIGAWAGYLLGTSNGFSAEAGNLAGFQEERTFTVVGTETAEKSKMWTPATLVCFAGEKVKISVINKIKSDPAVHGFTIMEYGVKEEVKRGKTTVVEFTADKPGLFTISCHLHPPHVGGQLLVLNH